MWQRITNWELWPFKVIYIPIIFLWVYYAIKARAIWFFSPVNPTLEFSGFEGETKKEMYDQLPRESYPKTIYIKANSNLEEVKQSVAAHGFAYPFIAKPDVGTQGLMVRKIESFQQLKHYHELFDEDYLIQEFVELPMEFSVFYIRYPDAAKGEVTGFILKEYADVTGDGVSTLLQLIQRHPKAKHREEEMRYMHADKLDTVIGKGERYFLSFKGNHNRGAKFFNLHAQIDEQLRDVFDNLNATANFNYGRWDIKCTSIEDLKAGKNISVLEFNGTGSEPNHIYDCGMTYRDAIKEIARHWKHMYRIGKINNSRGVPYYTYRQGKQQMDKAGRFFAKLRKYDQQY